MFRFVLQMCYIRASLLSQNAYHKEDHILIQYISMNDIIIGYLVEDTLDKLKLFKEMVTKIRNILIMITTEKDIDFKSLIMQTEMSLENIRYPYYETFIIFSSVKRILDDSAELQNSYLSVCILYKELDMIYTTLILITDKIRFDNDYTDCSISSLDLRSTNENCELEDENKSEDIFNKIQLTKISTDFLDSVFPTDKDTSVFIEAHEGGIRNSRKCVEKEFLLNIREGSEYFFKEKTPKQYSIKQSNLTKVELKKFMKFSCDKNVAKVIVMLFHYVSEIQGRNTRYEIILKEDGKYQIIWSYPKKSSMKAVKKYLMQ